MHDASSTCLIQKSEDFESFGTSFKVLSVDKGSVEPKMTVVINNG